ncbi:MAG: tripartite tricarboxylate transporter substrate binding protein [Sphaerochaetaceae bacterium]|nr:tripartite tricarboxylate transporter substrate binding protein [Sphaerochaetaceae bacterium]
MKKFFAVLALVALLVMPIFANGSTEGSASGSFTPTKDVEWTCTSKPGGGSDIFTQQIKDAMKNNGISNANVVVSYVTDGGGEVGRLQVATTSAAKADHTLLTFNSGDLMPMVANTDNRVENFTPLAIMAVDKQLLFVGKDSKYKSFQEVIDAVKAGTKVVIAGSKGDDIETYNALIKELGFTEAQLGYITNDATSGAITALLGGHVDLCLSKPAAAAQYVEAGSMVPILALSTQRYESAALAGAPILSELGYNDVEVPVWRGVVGPKTMSAAAAAYWVDCLQKVTETQSWKDYLEKNGLMGQFIGGDDAVAYMQNYQKDYLAKIGK